MTKVIAYRGKISLKGAPDYDADPFFNVERFIYGETPGAVLDSIIAEAVRIHGEIRAFIRKNRDTGYKMDSENWWISITIPELLEDRPLNDDSGITMGSVIHSLNGFMYAVLQNHKLATDAAFREFDRLYVPADHTAIYSARGVDKMVATVSITGADLDAKLVEWAESGALDQWRRNKKAARRAFEDLRRWRVAEAARKRKEKEQAEARELKAKEREQERVQAQADAAAKPRKGFFDFFK
jgi:hypothetical protein